MTKMPRGMVRKMSMRERRVRRVKRVPGWERELAEELRLLVLVLVLR